MKTPGFKELALGGLMAGILVLIGYEVLDVNEAILFSYIVWFFAFLYGFILLKAGFDYYRIRYSFSLTFFSIIIFLYELIILLTGGIGLIQAVAVALTPYLGISILGSLYERIMSRRTVSSLVKTRVALIRRMRAVFYQLILLCGSSWCLVLLI